MASPSDNNTVEQAATTAKAEEEDTSLKCATCSRKARKGCTKSLCLKCCSEESCVVHNEQRAQNLFREQIFSGTTPLQLKLQARRALLIKRGQFKESSFIHMGDTTVIWNVRDYLAKPKWRAEAMRKSGKRQRRARPYDGEDHDHDHDHADDDGNTPPIVHNNRRRRFRQLLQERYEQNLGLGAASSS